MVENSEQQDLLLKNIPYQFGKKQKTEEINASCFYYSAVQFITQPDNQKNPILLTHCEYFNQCLLFLIMNCDNLSFDQQKCVLNLLSEALKIVDEDQSNFTANFLIKGQDQFYQIIQFLLKIFEKKTHVSFAGNILRNFINNLNLFTKMCDMVFIEKLSENIADSQFEVFSESFETFRELLIQQSGEQKKIVAEFVSINYEQIFQIFNNLIKQENSLCQLVMLQSLHQIIEDPLHQQASLQYLNKKENLIMIMNTLQNSNKLIKYTALEILDIFFKNIDLIQKHDIAKIILKNLNEFLKLVKELTIEEEENFTELQASIIKNLENIDKNKNKYL